MTKRLALLCALGLAALAAALAGTSAATAASRDEIVINCQECEASATDVFAQSWNDTVQAFNAKYKGKYRVNVQHYGGGTNDLPYWQRLAIAGRLPDIFIIQSTELATIAKTGKLFNLASDLSKDKAWKNAFYPDVFAGLSGSQGQIWAIPE